MSDNMDRALAGWDGTGMKPVDLTHFRNASRAKKTHITTTGGDVSIATNVPSDMSVLWGECFGSKERKFLRELLTSKVVYFSLASTYQIHVRTLFHANTMSKAMNLRNGLRREGKFVMFLHDLRGDLTTSWTWAKFIRAFHRRGYSVVAVDLPGFGVSSVSQMHSCPQSQWNQDAANIVAKIMEELGIAQCHIVAVGHTAGVILQVLKSFSHRLHLTHVLVNPILDRHMLFSDLNFEPPPGAGPAWKEELRAKHLQALVDLLRKSASKIWFIFDREGKYRNCPHTKDKKLLAEWEMAHETHEMLFEASRNEYVKENLTTTELTKEDLCEAQVGKRIPVRMLVPSRHLKASMARFMDCYDGKRWDRLYKPHHVAFQDGRKMRTQAGIEHCDVGNRFDNDESSDEESEASRSNGMMNAAQRALGMMHHSVSTKQGLVEEQQKSIDAPSDATLQRVLATQRAKDAISLHESSVPQSQGSTPKTSVRRSESEGAITRQMSNVSMGSKGGFQRQMSTTSSNPAPLVKTNRDLNAHALASHAETASRRLSMTGANASPMPVTADAVRDRKVMNWTKVPFEPDLSYGVRKMYLDALDASVESYREEQQKEFMSSHAFASRTGMRVNMRRG